LLKSFGEIRLSPIVAPYGLMLGCQKTATLSTRLVVRQADHGRYHLYCISYRGEFYINLTKLQYLAVLDVVQPFSIL